MVGQAATPMASELGACEAEGIEAKRVGKEPNLAPLLKTVAAATAEKTGTKWDFSPRVAADIVLPRRPLGACAADGTFAATRKKLVSRVTASCAQGPTLDSSVPPRDPRFSQVSRRCLLTRSLLGRSKPTASAVAATLHLNPSLACVPRWRLPSFWGFCSMHPRTVESDRGLTVGALTGVSCGSGRRLTQQAVRCRVHTTSRQQDHRDWTRPLPRLSACPNTSGH
jgi:hypothetical protein